MHVSAVGRISLPLKHAYAGQLPYVEGIEDFSSPASYHALLTAQSMPNVKGLPSVLVSAEEYCSVIYTISCRTGSATETPVTEQSHPSVLKWIRELLQPKCTENESIATCVGLVCSYVDGL